MGLASGEDAASIAALTGVAGRLGGVGSSSAAIVGEGMCAAGLLLSIGAIMGLTSRKGAASTATLTGVAGRLEARAGRSRGTRTGEKAGEAICSAGLPISIGSIMGLASGEDAAPTAALTGVAGRLAGVGSSSAAMAGEGMCATGRLLSVGAITAVTSCEGTASTATLTGVTGVTGWLEARAGSLSTGMAVEGIGTVGMRKKVASISGLTSGEGAASTVVLMGVAGSLAGRGCISSGRTIGETTGKRIGSAGILASLAPTRRRRAGTGAASGMALANTAGMAAGNLPGGRMPGPMNVS